MRIEYVHASKYGNGARVADEFRSRMAEPTTSRLRRITFRRSSIRGHRAGRTPRVQLAWLHGLPHPEHPPLPEGCAAPPRHALRAADHRDGAAAGQEDRRGPHRGRDLSVPSTSARS